ncbi:MAG: peptidoglycan editing factor PgeF [Rhodobacteraceae bacterium]|nr:peptidoglycan editing factor PgeF [Paracoccaceae bacterium]
MTLEIITSEALDPVRHGFFTRKGGASAGIFAGLNCGIGSTDQTEVVMLNRHMVADAMQVEPDHLVSAYQIHSADVVTVSEVSETERPKADAMVTRTKGLALGILTADCAPILFADTQAGVIGAAHAGWKGALSGVIHATVSAMEDLGASRAAIHACIGPCISQRAYEVGPEFLDDFLVEDRDFSRFFAQGEGDRYLFDLPGFCLQQLRDEDLAQASWTGHCTYSDEDRFYSFRRTTHHREVDYGRLISAVSL